MLEKQKSIMTRKKKVKYLKFGVEIMTIYSKKIILYILDFFLLSLWNRFNKKWSKENKSDNYFNCKGGGAKHISGEQSRK